MNNITDVRGVTVHSQTKAPTQVTFDFYHYVTPRTLVGSLSFKF
jgi:outer membrane receptor protein involved in Fe transport